jgi:hypothetical protein
MKRKLAWVTYCLLGVAIFGLKLTAQEQEQAGETEYRVKLLSQISTDTGKKGDKIAAQIISPQEYADFFMEGQIRALSKGKGKSSLRFSFDTIEAPDHSKSWPIRSSIKYVVNSQGKPDVDDEGTVIKKTNNVAKAAAGAGIGAALGGAVAGGEGAAIGAGAGAAAALVFIEFTGEGATRITFAPGSEFVMLVKKH